MKVLDLDDGVGVVRLIERESGGAGDLAGDSYEGPMGKRRGIEEFSLDANKPPLGLHEIRRRLLRIVKGKLKHFDPSAVFHAPGCEYLPAEHEGLPLERIRRGLDLSKGRSRRPALRVIDGLA